MKKQEDPVKMPEPLLPYQPLWMILGRGRKFVQLAGVFGSLAVIAAAYGAHGADLHGKKDAWANAVQIHFFHTLALLAVPFHRRPNLVSSDTHIIMHFYATLIYHN